MINSDVNDASAPARDGSARHVVLVGEMGVGKTTVGRLLAGLLGRPFIDSDALFETEFGTTGAAFAQVKGVAALHRQELRLFVQMVGTVSAAVLAPAASIIEEPMAREALTDCWVLWLRASPEVGMDRIGREQHRRSIDLEELKRLRDVRRVLYEDVADYEIETDSRAPDELAEELARVLKRFD